MKKKRTLDYKKILKISLFIGGIFIIILMSVLQIALDPSRLNVWEWLSNTLILVGIMIFFLFLGESIGRDKQLENIEGLYQTNLRAFNEKNKEIENITIYFSQFYYWYKKQELFYKKTSYLINHDVDGEMVENIIKHIKHEHLEKLSKHAIKLELENGDVVYIEKQGEKQIEAIREMLDGKVKIDSPNPSYFLNAFEDSGVKSELEVGKQIDRTIKFNRRFNRFMRIIISTVVSLIWATLTVNEMITSGSTQMWMNLVSRLLAATGAASTGWSSAVIEIKLRAQKLKNKYDILLRFESAYNNKEFIPKNANELAKENYEAYIKEQERLEEERLKNLVIPEIVEDEEEEDLEEENVKEELEETIDKPLIETSGLKQIEAILNNKE